MSNILQMIQQNCTLEPKQIQNIITLLEDGATIPFIARYRKELTGNADEITLLEFQEIYEYCKKLKARKEQIEKILKEKDSLTPTIQEQLLHASSLVTLEDIYEPYKGTKNSRADMAIANGLTNLANIIQTQKYTISEIQHKAKGFLNQEIKTIEEAISGAKDIIALRYSQEIKTKEILRANIQKHSILVAKPTKTFDENGLYKEFKEFSQKTAYIKPHKLLALFRAQNEKQITIKIEVDEEYIIDGIKKFRVKKCSQNSSDLVVESYIDGLKRLLLPALKREHLSNLKESASDMAIELFGKNLEELLLTPPLLHQVILGIDPGYKTGCKCAVIDQEGNYLHSFVIYLFNTPQKDEAIKLLQSIVTKFHITAIAIGNGTASNETVDFIEDFLIKTNQQIDYAVVSEIGASVYSASKLANEEYPHLDVTIRGAISIAQRLRDPMAALVKIDPKALGLGQYQHDLDQKKLEKKLQETTELLVNKVGVDLNSASQKLLSFVSGISQSIAAHIIEFRNKNKGFQTKEQLLEVKGLGNKTYEQCVGFVRIQNGRSPFDNTTIHPESYQIASFIQNNFNLEFITSEQIEQIANKFSKHIETIKQILQELTKPGFDIRTKLDNVIFCKQNKSFNELKEGDNVSGVVRNITDFGAFIDIGLKNDALLHISQISQKRIKHPSEILHINQQLNQLKIFSIDKKNNKISLTLKE